jgi:hypothetical protein
LVSDIPAGDGKIELLWKKGYQSLLGLGIIKLFPARESLVVTSRLRTEDGTTDNLFHSVVCKQVLTNYFKLNNLMRTDIQYLLILSYKMEEKKHFCTIQDMRDSVHLSTGQDWPTWLLS